jgi:hypothetical protein
MIKSKEVTNLTVDLDERVIERRREVPYDEDTTDGV